MGPRMRAMGIAERLEREKLYEEFVGTNRLIGSNWPKSGVHPHDLDD